MSKVQLQGNANGTGIFTIASPNSNTDRTLTLPDITGTILTNATNLAGLTGVGKVLQVVQGTPTTTNTVTNGTTYVVTNLTVTITPSSATSKILILHNGMVNTLGNTTWAWYTLYRNSTNLFASGAQGAAGGCYGNGTTDLHTPTCIALLDSPATTSATTYAIYLKSGTGGTSVRYNADGWYSTINAVEIAA